MSLKIGKHIRPWGETTTFAEFAKKFKSEMKNTIHWHTSYGVSTVPEEYLHRLFKLALPYEAVASNHRYGEEEYYNEINDWLGENCKDMVMHTNIAYRFENEDEAIQFKLRWG